MVHLYKHKYIYTYRLLLPIPNHFNLIWHIFEAKKEATEKKTPAQFTKHLSSRDTGKPTSIHSRTYGSEYTPPESWTAGTSKWWVSSKFGISFFQVADFFSGEPCSTFRGCTSNLGNKFSDPFTMELDGWPTYTFSVSKASLIQSTWNS